MSHPLLAMFAFLGGGLIAAQAGFNARLGTQVGSPLLASTAAFLTSFVCAAVFYGTFERTAPTPTTLASVPLHLWIVGGLMSAVAVCSFIWLIPQIGITPVIVCGLVGQLIMSLVASHFGWWDLPQVRVDATKIVGTLSLLVGTLLVTR